MASEVTRPDEVGLRAKLAELTQEHRDLDAAIDAFLQAHRTAQADVTVAMNPAP